MFSRSFTSRKIFVSLLAMGMTALLGACGGGGGGEVWNYSPPVGTAPTTPIAIDTTNSLDVASEAFTSFAASQAGTAFTPSQSGAATSPVVSGVETTSNVSVLDVTRKLLEIYNPGEPQIVSGATAVCDEGTTITYPDSGLGIYSFNSCILGDIVLDGQIRFSGTVTAEGFTGSLIYNQLTVSDAVTDLELLSIHGQINIVESNINGVLSGTYSGELLAITFGNEVIDLADFNFSFSIDIAAGINTVSLNYTINSTLLNGSIIVSTASDFLYYVGEDYPYDGQMVITGENNSKVKLTVVNGGTGSIFDNVTIETDEDGNGIYESGLTTLTWGDLTS